MSVSGSMNIFKSICKNSLKSILLNLPTPVNISIMWNFGSLLGVFLFLQILSGVFLSMHYCASVMWAFKSVVHIMHDVKYGWLIRFIHMNGASLYFLLMFMHIGRGLYYESYKLVGTWVVGSMIFLVSMGVAFLGYVLPWGQMSFWGATVITNLVSAIPYIGGEVVQWLWGGFSVSNSTLNRFFSLHFIMPFGLLVMVLIHLMFLHITGSSNPSGVNSDFYKVSFHMYFTIKDIVGVYLLLILLLLLCCFSPYVLSDPENFNLANPMVTPVHIQPEWYFLFAYAILRSIPNKLGGVISLMLSVCIIIILPLYKFNYSKSSVNYPINQFMFWLFLNVMILLTWIGMKPVDYPYVYIGQIFTVIYFIYYLSLPFFFKSWDKMMIF